MSRIKRKHMVHAFNHVMIRGNNKQALFHCQDDYQKFLDLTESISNKYNFEVHLFCLMTNHVHLLIRTFEIPLSRIMAVLLSNYSKYFSKKYEYIGHLFQRRFLAKHVNHKDYFLELLFYIHANPLNANMVKDFDEYHWSSHHCYKHKTNFSWVETYYLENLISDSRALSYSGFIHERQLEPKPNVTFCTLDNKGLLTLTTSNESQTETIESINLTYFDFTSIANVICKITQNDITQLSSASKKRQLCLTRALVAYYAHFMGALPLRYIAIQFERHVDSVSDTMYRYLKNDEFITLKKKCHVEFEKLIAAKLVER